MLAIPEPDSGFLMPSSSASGKMSVLLPGCDPAAAAGFPPCLIRRGRIDTEKKIYSGFVERVAIGQ
jgi:hypothetical protein